MSQFGIEDIQDLVSSQFGLQVEFVQRIEEGRALNYHIFDREGKQWLLKAFQPDYDTDRIGLSADFVDYLADAKYPVRRYVSTVDGSRVVERKGRAVVVIPFVVGNIIARNQVIKHSEMREIGRMCGWLHRLGNLFPMRQQFDGMRELGRSLPIAIARLRAIHDLASQAGDLVLAEGVTSRISILETIGSTLQRNSANMQTGVIHGDYHCQHVIWDNGKVAAVIDVLGESHYPGWEVMRSFVMSAPDLANLSQNEVVNLWSGYLEAYRSENPATTSGVLSNAYDFYLLQLIRSPYGLVVIRPGEQGHPEHALREFGNWRTRTAVDLARHRGRLRELLKGD